jgi:tRNA A37 threonylcarbamoyladenosine dehydratase
VTNINRQIHALTETVGRSKAELLADRIRAINPSCTVRVIRKFFSHTTADEILAAQFDIVLDTIDRVENKTLLIAECVKRGMQVVTVGSGGDRINSSSAVVTDLARTIHDPLLQIVRKQLRQKHGFPKGERAKFLIPCIYAPQQRNQERESTAATCEMDGQGRRSCNDGLGSAVFVTGALGFMAAGEAVRILGESRQQHLYPWHGREKLAM